MWVKRVGEIIGLHDGPLLIEENLYGISEIADSLISPDGRVLWIEFDQSGLKALRATSWGIPDANSMMHLADALRRHREILHPLRQPIVIITRAEYALDEVAQVLADGSTGHHVVVCATTEAIQKLASSYPKCRVLTVADLSVNSVEARNMLSLRDTEDNWTDLLEGDVVVGYEELISAAYSGLGVDIPARRTPLHYSSSPACLTKDGCRLVELLSRNRQWQRALDVALATDSSELLSVIDQVGEDALLHNEIDSFRRKLLLLPPQTRNSAEVLYWRVVADSKLGLSSDAASLAKQLLQNSDCPRLRALLTTLGIVECSIDVKYAPSEDEDPMLVVYKSHLMSLTGTHDESVDWLRRMVDVFRAAGRDYRVVQSLAILANSLTLQGRFREAAYWGMEARRMALDLNLREYEVTFVTGPAAYALIMSGEWQSAGEMLSQVPNAESFAGLPFAEGIISTMADHFAVAGYFATALKWYELVSEKYNGPASNIVMPDVSLMLVRLGRSSEALRTVKARLTQSAGDEVSRRWLELAHGLALLETDATSAMRELDAVLSTGSQEMAAPFRARAALILALEADRNGFSQSAFQRLDSVAPTLLELGETGWQLLAGRDADVLSLRSRWLDSQSLLEIEFMVGKGNWSFRSTNSGLVQSKRLKELIFVLTWFPDGIRGEYITELLGWGALTKNTVRRHLHRLRKYVPVEGRPYRLSVEVKADYLCLLQAIEERNVSKALRLYVGPLLRDSDAPFIREKRMTIESQLRVLVLDNAGPDETAEFALKLGDDLELLECALAGLVDDSPLRRRLMAQIVALENAWAVD